MSDRVSIVIPTLNEELALPETLARVCALQGGPVEVIVADGGSTDGTVALAQELGAMVVSGARGRGPQQHAGALAATGEILWFLHADTYPPPEALEAMRAVLRDPGVIGGHFHLRFTGNSVGARFVTGYQSLLRRMKLIYGDTAIFLRREAYLRAGGFAAVPLFDDLELTRRVRRYGRFVAVKTEVTTSSRRFEGKLARTLVQWVTLQGLYELGVPPRRLAVLYKHLR